MWNMLNLECPLSDVCEYGLEDGLILNDLPNLVSLLTTSAEILTEDHPMWTEIKVFRNIEAQYKRILHCDKSLLLLQRVGGCLRKMVLLNLSKCYLDLGEHVLLGLQSQQPRTFIPSRQQLEFVLIRTQSAAKLISEALHYSRKTFCHLIQKLKVGHLILNLMMATSVTARVNILFKGLLHNLFDVYRKLSPWCSKMKVGTHEWPQTLNLPEDLEMWLKPEESELPEPNNLSGNQIDFWTNFFEKKQVENPESDSESIIEVKSSDDNDSVIVCTSDPSMDTSVDLGEVIVRNENQPQQNQPKAVNTDSKTLLLKRIAEVKTVKKMKMIWNNLKFNSEDLLSKKLTDACSRRIDQIFVDLKEQTCKIKASPANQRRRRDLKLTLKTAALKFAKELGLVDKKALTLTSNNSNASNNKLRAVKTFKGLKDLYLSLYNMLLYNGQYDKSYKLKRVFKSRKADIKLLIENGERAIARKLIFCTSKVFLTRFQS